MALDAEKNLLLSDPSRRKVAALETLIQRCLAKLYCTVLYCTVLYCTVLYYTVLYYNVLHCTVLY